MTSVEQSVWIVNLVFHDLQITLKQQLIIKEFVTFHFEYKA